MSEISLTILDINELLRMPVSLFCKRTLENDAEEFIVQEAESLPRNNTISVKIHLAASEAKYKDDIAPAIHRHFCYRKDQSQKKIKQTLRYGWRILFIALIALAVIFSLSEFALYLMPDNRVVVFIRESFIILSWVALWRPLDLLLYDWYPIKVNINLYKRLEHCPVQVIIKEFWTINMPAERNLNGKQNQLRIPEMYKISLNTKPWYFYQGFLFVGD